MNFCFRRALLVSFSVLLETLNFKFAVWALRDDKCLSLPASVEKQNNIDCYLRFLYLHLRARANVTEGKFIY